MMASSFQYDVNGNMVSKTDSNGTTSYVYDSENRLVQLTTPNAQLVKERGKKGVRSTLLTDDG